MDILSDSNARRRNLIVMSLLIITYFLTGAHVTNDESLGIPMLNLVAEKEEWIYILAWLMFFYFWWQFRLHTPSIKNELCNALHFTSVRPNDNVKGGFTDGSDNDFYEKRTKLIESSFLKNAVEIIKKDYTINKPHEASIYWVMNSEFGKSDILPRIIIRLHFNYLGKDNHNKNGNEAFNLPTTQCLYIMYLLSRHHPSISSTALPQALALFAVLIAIVNTFSFVALAGILIFIVICFYLKKENENSIKEQEKAD